MTAFRRFRRRRGEASYPSSRRLPPAPAPFTSDDDFGLRPMVRSAFDGGMGRSPISAVSHFQVYPAPGRNTPPPYRAPFSAFDYWSRSLRIKVPRKVRFCIQRKQRREVLFAFRRAGYRGSAPKRHYNRNQNSQYRC